MVCETMGYNWGTRALVLNIFFSSSFPPVCLLRVLISWIIIFFISPPQPRNTLLCLTSRHTDRSWPYPFTCFLSKETILTNWWPPAENRSQPISTGLRKSTLCFSTSGVKPFASPLTPLRASSFLTCWRKTAHLSGQAHDLGVRQLWVVFLTLWVQARYFVSESEFLFFF